VRFRGQNALEDVNVEFAVFGRQLCRCHTPNERSAKADGERSERAAKPLSHNRSLNRLKVRCNRRCRMERLSNGAPRFVPIVAGFMAELGAAVVSYRRLAHRDARRRIYICV
jgi:hypothetical protein